MAGLEHRYNVTRTDGRDKPGGDRHGTRYFVLDPANDPAARLALRRYAQATPNDELAHDLLNWLLDLEGL